MGDDIVDLPVMRRVGFAASPKDASEEAQAVAHYVASLCGGKGAVREICDMILKARGVWEQIAERYEL